MGSLWKMWSCHCILLVTILLSTYSSAAPANQSSLLNEGVSASKPMKPVEEFTTYFEVPTDLPSTTEAILPRDATTVTTSTETSTTAAVVTTTEKPSTASSVTTKVTTTQEDVSTSKIVTTTKILGTSEITSSSTKSTTKSQPQVTTKQHVTSDKPISTTKHAGLLTIKQKASSETSNIENGSTEDSTTDSSFLGVDKNSFTAKVILPIAAGIILAVFIVLIVCSIRSCLDRKERKSSRRTMDHDMAPMDRVMLLADSSEDEF